jgi:hypothetical protein
MSINLQKKPCTLFHNKITYVLLLIRNTTQSSIAPFTFHILYAKLYTKVQTFMRNRKTSGQVASPQPCNPLCKPRDITVTSNLRGFSPMYPMRSRMIV